MVHEEVSIDLVLECIRRMRTCGKAKQASHVKASNLWCHLSLHSHKFIAFHHELILRGRDKIIDRNLPFDSLLAVDYSAPFVEPFDRRGVNRVKDTCFSR